MPQPADSETELAAILARSGLFLTSDQVRALLPGAVIIQTLLERVRAPLPPNAEPAVNFNAEQIP